METANRNNGTDAKQATFVQKRNSEILMFDYFDILLSRKTEWIRFDIKRWLLKLFATGKCVRMSLY